ncbi:hypothetical protein IAD21_01574 [Abditibacteriota bacterium]|nr:hypothetical protein IAD21_01574 [Abditibacteriota bacterium]
MKQILPVACGLLLGAAGLLLHTATAHAFSGEDPVFGHPWYHAQITREACKNLHFSFNPQRDAPDPPLGSVTAEILAMARDDPKRPGDMAAEAIGWHADYLDSYLYSPIWWAAGKDSNGDHGPAGIIKRYKVSRAVEFQLKSCHFDDLFSTPEVNAMWRRYASGTFAGLLWASEQNGGEGDVYAAQNILGASLHAMEDFYSHSSWVDKAERRDKTYFEYPRAQSFADNLFTGAYEHDHQLGVKSHGKWIPQNAIWGQPGVKQVMEVICDPVSPFSNSDECAAWKEVKDGTPMQPTVGGHKLPPSIMVYTPAGIALDNTWVADEAVKQRGIADQVTGPQAFTIAHDLAVRQATQWLQTLEDSMKKAGKGDFWQKIKDTPASDAQREAQYENYGQFPFMFMAAGEYPPKNLDGKDEWYLRVKLHTAEGDTGGTDSDIRLRAGGQVFTLDYLHHTNPIFTYNDFEAGDNDSYVVGPFDKCPDNLDLINDAADGKELLDAAGRDFVNAVEATVDKVGDLLLDIVGGHADKVAVNKQLWMPDDLAAMPMGGDGQGFNVDLNGGKEGNYRANGTIFKVGEDDLNYQFEVHIDSLSCIKESTFDRFSNSDEPFLLCALNPLPGPQEAWLSPVYEDVDTGETPTVDHGFARVSIPKSSGMLNLALTLMESDDEKPAARQELLEKFAGTYKDKTDAINRTFTQALATTVAANWKLADIEVAAWSRNGRVRQGTVLQQHANRWIPPGEFASFPLDVNAARDYGVSTDDLLPQLTPETKPPTPTDPIPTKPVPTDPVPTDPVPTIPLPTNPSFNLATWVDEWDTTYGRVKLALNNGVLSGRFYVKNDLGMEREDGMLELRADGAKEKLVGSSNYNDGTKIPLTLALNPDNDTFSGLNSGTDKWNGKRHRATVPAPPAPRPTPKPTIPVVTPPLPTNPLPKPPGIPLPTTGGQLPTTGGHLPGIPTTPATGTDGNFLPLKEFAIRVDSAAPNTAGNKLEVFATLKNRTPGMQLINGGEIAAVVTDADGVGFMNDTAFYRPEGEPTLMSGNREIVSQGELKVRLLITIPEGTSQLKTLTLWQNKSQPQTVDISNVSFPGVRPAANLGAMALSNGTSEFKPCGESLDVRFDGFRKARSGWYEAFFTFKNTTDTGLRSDVLDFNSSALEVFTLGADGGKQRYDELMRANGEKAIWIPIHYAIVSGGEARVRYTFSSKNDVPKPVKVTVGDRVSGTTLEWPVSAP